MVKIYLKLIDSYQDDITSNIRLLSFQNLIEIGINYGETRQTICLDKSTAIKFAKTLRTEINKIEE